MASYEQVNEAKHRRFGRIVQTWIGCLGSFTLSLAGGLILTWWELNYHPNNEQQWMVPLGLILLVTPVIVWLAVFISDICNSTSNSPIDDTSPEKPLHASPEIMS